MAKRKKRHHIKRHSRRRMSGVKDFDATSAALVIVGAVGARMLSNKLSASTNTTMQKLSPYAALALGIVLPMATKNAMLKSVSLGLVAGGGVTLLGPTGLKVISGFENTIAGRVGYPYSVLPYQQKVAGIEDNNQWVSKPNFSGSGKSQMNVISGISPDGSGCACAY